MKILISITAGFLLLIVSCHRHIEANLSDNIPLNEGKTDPVEFIVKLYSDSLGLNISIKNTSNEYIYIPDIRPLEVYLNIIEVDGKGIDNDWLFNNRYYTARTSDSARYDLAPREFLNALNEFVSKWIKSKHDALSEFEKTNLRNYSNLAKVSYLVISPFQEYKEFISLSPPLRENSKYWISFNYDRRKLGIVKLLDSINFTLPSKLGRYMKAQTHVTQDSIRFPN